MFCGKCGAAVLDEGKFCPKCGEAVFAPDQQPAPASTPALAPEVAPPAPQQPAPQFAAPELPMPQQPALAPGLNLEPPVPQQPAPQFAPPAPGLPVMPPPNAPTDLYPPNQFQPANPQGNFQATGDPQFSAPASPAQGKPKKSKKGLWIALIVVVLLIIAAVAAYFIYQGNLQQQYDQATELYEAQDYQGAHDGFSALGDYQDSADMVERAQQWMDYEAAKALLDAEDYQAALDAFDALGSFEDSAQLAADCQNNLDFIAAQELFESGDFDGALKAFESLKTAGFAEASQWVDKTKYAQADKLQKDGNLYEAYKAFKAMGSYDDAAERMAACTTPFPADGTLSFDQAFASSNAQFILDGSAANYASYFKLYSGSTLVSAFWVNAGGSVTLDLAPGSYSLKQAVGDAWFGEEIMFGEEGSYMIMEFEEGEAFTLENNYQLTLSLVAADSADSNVDSNPTDREGF